MLIAYLVNTLISCDFSTLIYDGKNGFKIISQVISMIASYTSLRDNHHNQLFQYLIFFDLKDRAVLASLAAGGSQC